MIRAWMNDRSIRRRLSRFIACGLSAVLSVGGIVATGALARSFEPADQDQGAPPAKSEKDQSTAKVSQFVIPADREKQAAEHKKHDAGSAPSKSDQPKPRLPLRPVKSVTPPTLTSAELDRLIAQYLTKNSPKVEPATSDDRRRVRPPDLLRPDRPAAHARAGSSRSCATAPRTSAPG